MTKPAYLRDDPNRVAKLTMIFDDVGAIGEPEDSRYLYFSKQQASDVIAFADRYAPKVAEFVVNCEAGISRSRGIAVALGLIHGDPTPHVDLGFPNARVVRMLIEAHNEVNSDSLAMPIALRALDSCERNVGARFRGPIGGPMRCECCDAISTQRIVDIFSGDTIAPVAPLEIAPVRLAPRSGAPKMTGYN